MYNYKIKEKIVRSGESKIFKHWASISNITEADFLDALKWLCEDPKNGGPRKNLLTREIALSPKGIIRLHRQYFQDGSGPVLYKDGFFWGGEVFTSPCDNPDYADENGMIKTIQKICLSAIERV